METYLATLIALYWKFRQNEIVQTDIDVKQTIQHSTKNF